MPQVASPPPAPRSNTGERRPFMTAKGNTLHPAPGEGGFAPPWTLAGLPTPKEAAVQTRASAVPWLWAWGMAALVAAAGCKKEAPARPATVKLALLLPESKTARYESHDRPRFEKKVAQLCPECEVIYGNADQDAAKQQNQAEAALTNGARALVLDPVDSASAVAVVARAKQAGVP